ncbi:Ribosome biogenesis protein nsa1 (NOP7-associated protein 1) [Coemansia interrupta]|uniref:Ribosome biogenesis protein NSA1 n=1 Tax=Coemansia interrupta TaxID=1126814 RepID=A0A9W8LKI7_9FUNG|nr:Ribosome biogenesis protein nsa1 (NOP7-associated protein 1) [Coemansia interrupta]
MRFYTGDEAGLIKVVDIDHKVSLLEAQSKAAKKVRADAKAKINAKPGEKVEIADNILSGVEVNNFSGSVSKERTVQQMITGSYEDEQAFFVARKNGDIEALSKATGQSLYVYSEPDFTENISVKHKGKYINGRNYVGLGAGKEGFVSCSNMGEVRFQRFEDANSAGMMKLPVGVVKMRSHKDKFTLFAAGGHEQELSIWDAETACSGDSYLEPVSEPLFRSQNVEDDWLGLRVPVWITDMQFLDANTTNPQMAVSTGHKHIRIYDTKAQRRPVHSWEIGKNPILHTLASHVKPELFISDNLGNMQQLDLRNGKIVGSYKGIAGAVADMALSEDGKKVAEVGLDRFLRVYEADGMRRMLHRAYIKQRVTAVVWDWDVKDIDQVDIDRQETEDIWESMETLGKKPNKRKAKEVV